MDGQAFARGRRSSRLICSRTDANEAGRLISSTAERDGDHRIDECVRADRRRRDDPEQPRVGAESGDGSAQDEKRQRADCASGRFAGIPRAELTRHQAGDRDDHRTGRELHGGALRCGGWPRAVPRDERAAGPRERGEDEPDPLGRTTAARVAHGEQRDAAGSDGRSISAQASTLCAARKRRRPDAAAVAHWLEEVRSRRSRAASHAKMSSAPAAQRIATVARGGISATTNRIARNVTPQTT